MFNKAINSHQQLKRFRLIVLSFFLCLILPLTLIIYYGFQTFENEQLFQYRWKSSSALTQLNKTLAKRLLNEQERSPLQYHYYQNNADKLRLNRRQNTSPLSRPREPHYLTDLFGLIGYFNITDKTLFNSPLLPYTTQALNITANLPISKTEIARRITSIQQVKQILVKQGLLAQATNVAPLKATDAGLTTGLNAGLNTELITELINQTSTTQVSRFSLIETDNQQVIFYRDVIINQQKSVQGFIVDKKTFLFDLLKVYVRRALFDNKVQLQLIDKNDSNFHYFAQYNIDERSEVSVTRSDTLNQTLIAQSLYQGELTTPFDNLSLHFSTGDLPLGPATHFVVLFILVMIFVIVAGCIGFYWLGIKQIALAEQRMNFVSSVSHELKTPLTSILMYSEMLKSGMVTDKNNQHDYYHFIYDESERLSRLINNVLQLSNLNQQRDIITPEYINIDVLQEVTQSKLATLITQNNFQLNFIIDKQIPAVLQAYIDIDAFSQIMINLIDNAVKFYNAAQIHDLQRQKIDVSFSLNGTNAQSTTSANKLIIAIRDYGPGISGSQHNKIFELFYRGGNEMTRTSSGTGIGLALVRQLVIAQDGEIGVTRHSQGVSFELTFIARQRG